MSDLRLRRSERPGRELEHTEATLTWKPEPPGAHVRHHVDDIATRTHHDHVDREPHAARMHATAGNDEQAVTGVEMIASQQADGALNPSRGDADAIRQHGASVDVPGNQAL